MYTRFSVTIGNISGKKCKNCRRARYCLALGALAPALGAHRAAVLAALEREAAAFRPPHPISESLEDAETRQSPPH